MNTQTLQAIVGDQREVIKRIFTEEKIVEREFLDTWKKLIDSNLIKVITGIRRSGKSIFSLQLLGKRDYAYINFDDERLVGLKTVDLNIILETFYQLIGDFKYIILDEIQNIEKWELFVNRLQRQGLNVILTGSNAKLLSRELATHLTGRYISMEIFQFSFREFLAYENFKMTNEDFYSIKKKSLLIRKLREYISLGGFPEVVKEKELSKQYLPTLYSTIITKDIVSRYKINFATTFREISNYLLSNYSKYITFNKIKNTFGLKSPHTAKKYISYLQESYLFFLLDKFSYKYKEVTASPKKVYAIDTGMINILAFESGKNFGRLIENIVAIDLQRKKIINPMLEFYYWKDYQQREVDFVVKKGLNVEQLIQVTAASEKNEIEKREYTSLLKASKELRCNNLLMVTWDYESQETIEGKKIIFVPLWKWLISNEYEAEVLKTT